MNSDPCQSNTSNTCPPFPEWGTKGMAVSDHQDASDAARDVLKEGGNAVDAAVTLSLTLGVACPQYTGIGGGGFSLVFLPGMDRPRLFDFREVAPSAAHPDMFGEEDCASVRGGLAPGVPGTVAGMAKLLDEFGTISWERALAPGIELARKGVEVYPNLRRVIQGRRSFFEKFEEISRVFLRPEGVGTEPGSRLVLNDLATTYERMAKFGPREFYEGELAEKIVAGVREAGGLFQLKDLANYKVLEREPISCHYGGREFYTIGPPSGGGIQLLQMLQLIEPFKLKASDFGSALCYHLQSEAMRLSFADRSSWIADPDFFNVPVEAMLDSSRLAELTAQIDPQRAMELVETPPLRTDLSSLAHAGPGFGHSQPGVGGTAAYLTADQYGGFVSSTESVNLWFGSMVIPKGTGVILNNVMDDFSRNPGTPDAFGLVSSKINQVAPGKRPASSASPSLVFKNGVPVAALASAGGPRIAPTVFQMAMNVFDFGMNVRQSMDAPRVHHQWLPNELNVEQMISPDTRKSLEAMGHKVVEGPSRSHAASLVKDETDGIFYGVGDFRAGGAASGWC